MQLIANRQLTGDYGTVSEGEAFEASEEVAAVLLKSGVAYARFAQPFTYETKVVTPEAPEVKPQSALPFRESRDVPHSDKEPAALAAVRDAVRAVSDLADEGNTRRVERRRRRGHSPE